MNRKIVPLMPAKILHVERQLLGQNVRWHGERHRRWKIAPQVVPGRPGHRQIRVLDEVGELIVDQLIDLAHLRLRDERVTAIGAELPAIEVIGMPGDHVGELRLPQCAVGLQELHERRSAHALGDVRRKIGQNAGRRDAQLL